MQQVVLFAKNRSSAIEKPCGDRAKSFSQILEESVSIGFQDQSNKPLDHLSLRPIYLIISPTLRLELTYEFFLTCNGINFTKEVITNLSKKVKVSWLLSALCALLMY